MVFISFLLMFNNIINIIFYSYYKYNNKFIANNEEKLYVYETYTYKLFISMLKDNLENYNNLYFTLNTSSNLLKIFIIFTIVFFWLLIISDMYLVILDILDIIKEPGFILLLMVYGAILSVLMYIYIFFYSVNYSLLLIISVSLWLFVNICTFSQLIKKENEDKNENNNLNLISIIFLFVTFFKPDDDSEDEKFKKLFYYTILIFVFIIFVLLIHSWFKIFQGQDSTTISYEKYCFDICNDNKYNSLENYFHNTYFKKMTKKYLEEIKEKLEQHNIYTINKIMKFKDEEKTTSSNQYDTSDAFIDEIIEISNILKDSEYDYDKYDKLDFVKLVNIFINNELIYMNRNYGSVYSKNELHKDFNYLFNMNEKIVNRETYNIENVLIAAFPVKYINKYVTIL
jgi:hypothetical protein